MSKITSTGKLNGSEIAVIGMAGRFPMSRNIGEYWQNLRNGFECISFFPDEQLLSSGVDPIQLKNHSYVKAKGILADIELFDASFFGYSPQEAKLIDPQQRLLLECAEDALEYAGYDTRAYNGSVGVYAGTSMSTYLLNNLYVSQDSHTLENTLAIMANDKDFISTRISYKLDLRGPSVTVQTACSTSLVAVHMACQGLLSGECSMALAGGASVRVPQKVGYPYQEGGTTSPDGHCRAFDAQAQGMVAGEGVGMVVLKRLSDALADGDTIHAVIKGSAINNDGSRKVSYTAPSIVGQAQAIQTAHMLADVSPETISYVEAHGTGTPLGDPIEIAALTQAFGNLGAHKGFCAIGSVKTNIGHLDAAAGIAGFIKTVLALKYQELPPSLHFTSPNPQIDFASSPFYVNTTLSPWKAAQGHPRRAGVSSFGIGGTNAHLVLEEAPLPMRQDSSIGAPWQLLILSAKSHMALEKQGANLLAHLKEHTDLSLADVAYTLQVGRRGFQYRQMLVCQDTADAINVLATADPERLFTATYNKSTTAVAFLFPGQGAQYAKMASGLYQHYSLFRELLDSCAEVLMPYLGLDLRNILLFREEAANDTTKVSQQLQQTWLTQPTLFVVEYALARLWMSWGVHPQVMIGHSIGEYVAACLAGVFSLEDALVLVAMRGRLIQSMPTGAMLAVSYSPQDIQPLLGPQLALAAVNSPMQCVVSGSNEAVEALIQELAVKEIPCRRLFTSHAFHSPMMDPILDAFATQVKRVQLRSPQMPYLSNVTGTWITAEQATDPQYWVNHLRQTVRFADGLQTLLQHPVQVLLEVGPGHTLSVIVQQQIQKQIDAEAKPVVLSSLPSANERQSDVAFVLTTVGRLWLAGVDIQGSGIHAQVHPQRIPLPTYPFERQRYWIDVPSIVSHPLNNISASALKKSDIANWFYSPLWKQTILPSAVKVESQVLQRSPWLILRDESEIGVSIEKCLREMGEDVICVVSGNGFAKIDGSTYRLNPGQREDYNYLLQALIEANCLPQQCLHLWTTNMQASTLLNDEEWKKSLDLCFYSLLFLTQALGEYTKATPFQFWIVSSHLQKVTGDELLYPEITTLLGPCKVIPQEYPNITCRSIDIIVPPKGSWQEERLLSQIIDEITTISSEQIIAYREDHRWVQTFEPVCIEREDKPTFRLRNGGVYLITGGLGGIGLILAEYLARSVQAKLVLVGRSAFPDRNEWGTWLKTHEEQEQVSLKIRKLQRIEELGGQVEVFSADVASCKDMQEVINQVTKHFDTIHGVIHCAGIAGGGIIQLKTREMAERVFAPKIKGALVLASLLRDVDLDFLVYCSSLNAIIGGFGLVDYCSANAFLDALALRNDFLKKTFTLSINWDAWSDVGMTLDTPVPPQWEKLQAEIHMQAILAEEGIDAFDRVLHRKMRQVLISTKDISRQLELYHEQVKVVSLLESAEPTKTFLQQRPNLTIDYVAPQNRIEQSIANIWQTLLGIDPIGIYDNLLELGSDSLIDIQFLAQAKAIGLSLTNTQIYQCQTIAELAVVAENDLEPLL